jgi:hypothetical protein
LRLRGQKATDLDQLSAAVRAIEAKAKVSGLLIQRMEIGSPNEFAHCKTEAETVDKLLEVEAPGVPITAQERARVLEMFREVAEFINSCKAKPVNGPGHPSQRMIELARGNGASVPLASEDSQIGVRMRVCLYGQDRTYPGSS